MTTDYHVLLVGTDAIITNRIVRPNLQISILVEEEVNRKDYPGGCKLYVVNFADINACLKIASEIHMNQPIDAVLSFNEDRVSLAARIVDLLEVFGNTSSSVEFVVDKSKMRVLLNEHPQFATVKNQFLQDPSKLANVSSQFPFPMISKPVDGTGSQGVGLLTTPADIDNYVAYLADSGYEGPLIVEEYVVGTEYSVEAISHQEHHVIIGVTEKQTTGPPHFIETGHIFPAPLSETLYSELASCVLDLLPLLNLQIGASHTELILTDSGPVVIETHARPGGDRIPELIRLTTGVDIFDLTVSSLIERGLPLRNFNVSRVAAIDQIILPQGRLVSTNVHEILKNHSEVATYDFELKPGDRVNRVVSSQTRHGFYIYSADNYEKLSNLARELADGLIFEIVNQ